MLQCLPSGYGNHAVFLNRKLFFWMMLQDRLNARDLLVRKNFHIETNNCVLCDDEPNDHLIDLFFNCF